MRVYLQAICLLLVAGVGSACEEGADILNVGKYCYRDGEKIVTCTCPFSHCDYEANPLAEYGVSGTCKLSDDAAVFITFWVIFTLVCVCLIAWLCCCRGDGISFRGFCKGGCLCNGAPPPSEKRVTVVSESSVSTDDSTISTASTSTDSTDTEDSTEATKESKNAPDEV